MPMNGLRMLWNMGFLRIAACLVVLAGGATAFTPSLDSWRIDPNDIVPADAHIAWSNFVPMDRAAESAPGFPEIDWENLRNPILASRHGAIKNQAVLYHGGWFWIFPTLDLEQGTAFVRTRDFKTYEYLTPAPVFGMAPRFCRDGETWHVLFQLSAPDADRRIYHASSATLVDWTAPREAWAQTQPGARHIDAAIACEGGRYYAGFKSGQRLHVMRSVGEALDFRWEAPVRAQTDGWCEAYQFIKIDGQWHMMATGRAPKGFQTVGNDYTGSHEPFLHTMDGAGTELAHWARWTNKRHIPLPFSDWNRVMHANAAYLCDWRGHDGWFYLFFAGANDDTLCRGRGHCKIGVARSRNLERWYLPGEMEKK